MARDRSIARTKVRQPSRSHRLLIRSATLLAAMSFACGMNAGGCGTTPSVPGVSSGGSTILDSVPRPVILDSDHVLGQASASLIVVEYESYQSTACGRFARSEFPTIKQNYIDTGKIRWVFRHFPLASESRARPAAIAAECAGDQGKFFEYRDLIYSNPDSSGNVVLTDAQLKAYADTLGLDRTTFDACIAGDSKNSRIDQDVNSGTALGVTDAPTFIVDNQLVAGFTTAADLSKTLDRHLAGTQ